MTEYIRALRVDGDKPGDPGTPIRFKASTEGIKRDGLDLKAEDWIFDNVRANPTFLWSHGFTAQPAIGRIDRIDIEGTDTIVEVTFDQGDDFAAMIERKYRDGFLNAVSIGWTNIEVEEKGKRFAKRDVTEVSAVNVPADPEALMERQVAELRTEYREIGAILARFDRAQDADPDDEGDQDADPIVPAVSDRLGTPWANWRGVLMGESSWKKRSAAAGATKPHNVGITDEEVSPAYENFPDDFAYCGFDRDQKMRGYLPHHSESGEAIVRFVIESMARLYCGIAGIPDGEFQGVYDHLARHYRQAKLTPPDYLDPARLRALDREDVANLFPADQRELVLDLPVNPEMISDDEWARLAEISDELRAILAGRGRAAQSQGIGQVDEEYQKLVAALESLGETIESKKFGGSHDE